MSIEDASAAGPPSPPPRRLRLNSPVDRKGVTNEICTAKYNLFTFLPKFLYEQFRKYSNLFFLFIVILQQVPDVSPTGRWATLVPLVIILTISAVKEIVEDVRRRVHDKRENHSVVLVLSSGVWVDCTWRDLRPGHLVKLKGDNRLPADVILLSSNHKQSVCYIETANLDGETNHKLRKSPLEFPVDPDPEAADLVKLDGWLEFEAPNRFIYNFIGALRLDGEEVIPLGPSHLLLRGSKLVNTDWVYGIVTYTGKETKSRLNSVSTPLKRSHIEKRMNIQILLLFGILIGLAVASTVANHLWSESHPSGFWYLPKEASSSPGLLFLTFIILYNNLIPISLQVTLEMVKFSQALFIKWDLDMYDPVSGTAADARTSNLNEELGQVKYVFSDKTGTLTQNVMIFRGASVGGTLYLDETEENVTSSDSLSALQQLAEKGEESVTNFLSMLSVCHTVVRTEPSFPSSGDLSSEGGDEMTGVYQGASPDEVALVKGMAALRFVYTGRTLDTITVNTLGELVDYEILDVIEFTSTRKRMSVIVRTPDNDIYLYCKGADSVIYERLSDCEEPIACRTMDHLEMCARLGYRTLCVGRRRVEEAEYRAWREAYHKALSSLCGREAEVEKEAERIEQNLELLGATAIEDKLQQGVPDTITSLLRANIRIWVLTGDKQETAINIGYSCGLLSSDLTLLLLNANSVQDSLSLLLKKREEFEAECPDQLNSVGLVVDGKTLDFMLDDSCRKEFLHLAISCAVVVCCRVSPLQKAQVVSLVKKSTSSITLAIGDGANDVGMIQAADVGVGISGVEGLQAVGASDYSIAQFRFLKKLLLVHGVWNYGRVSKLILFSFYKNICLYVIEFWFAFDNGFSGQILFERWIIGLFNVIFTAVPPVALGLFDQLASANTLLKHPHLYRISQTSSLFTVRAFWMWMINGVWHSLLLYYFTVFFTSHDVVFSNGHSNHYLLTGVFVYTYTVVVVCLKSGLETTFWNKIHYVSVGCSILSWLIFFPLYSHIWPTLPVGPEMVGMDVYVYGSVLFWLGLILVPTVCLLRDALWKILRRTLFKTIKDEAEEFEEETLKESVPVHRVVEPPDGDCCGEDEEDGRMGPGGSPAADNKGGCVGSGQSLLSTGPKPSAVIKPPTGTDHHGVETKNGYSFCSSPSKRSFQKFFAPASTFQSANTSRYRPPLPTPDTSYFSMKNPMRGSGCRFQPPSTSTHNDVSDTPAAVTLV